MLPQRPLKFPIPNFLSPADSLHRTPLRSSGTTQPPVTVSAFALWTGPAAGPRCNPRAGRHLGVRCLQLVADATASPRRWHSCRNGPPKQMDVFGAPTARQASVWNTGLEAQTAAFEAVQPGVPCETVDAAARRIVEAAGFGPGYAVPGLPHRTGYGIGLEVHEWTCLVRGNTTPLAPKHVFFQRTHESVSIVGSASGWRITSTSRRRVQEGLPSPARALWIPSASMSPIIFLIAGRAEQQGRRMH